MVSRDKNYYIDIYFQAKTQYCKPSDIIAYHSKSYVKRVVDRIVYLTGYPEDRKLQMQLAGMKVERNQIKQLGL